MRIRSQQYVAAALSLGLAAIAAGALAWGALETSRAAAQNRFTDAALLGMSQLRSVMLEYLVARGERPRAQWLLRQESLARHLAASDGGPAEDWRMLRVQQQRLHSLRDAFTQLVRVHDEPVLSFQEYESAEALASQLVAELTATSQQMVSDFTRVSLASDERMERVQRTADLVVLAVIGVLGATLAAQAALTRANVLQPLAALQAGMLAAGGGQLDFSARGARADEIGDLARGFEAMTVRLAERERTLHENAAHLGAVNKELEAFAYSVSHDLRAPLRALDGFSLGLLEDYRDRLDEEGRDALERIRAASQRMGRLIDELLSLSRITRTELRLADVDLSAVAREIADSLQQSQPERAVRWEIAPELRVRGDPGLIRIALYNLLDNAWKFTGKSAQAVIRVGARASGGATEYFVADNGVGFDMAHAGRLFGAFQRLHSAEEFPGTGVGLAIVQRVVRRHDGLVRAEARPGEGATLYFTLRNGEDASNG